MKYLAPVLPRRLLGELRAAATRPWQIMEVRGGQTHTLVRQGIDELLPAGIRMIHGDPAVPSASLRWRLWTARWHPPPAPT